MNWGRGVVLASLHLSVALLVIARTESDYWPDIRSERVRVRVVLPPSATAEEAMEVNFYPCDEGGIIDRAAPPAEIVDGAANMPAALLVGWHEPCAQPSRLDAIVEKRYGRTRTAEVLILAIQCAVFVVLWFLIGGYPLMQSRRWWLEPAAFITACTAPAALVSLLPSLQTAALIPAVEIAAEVLAIVVMLAWLWWLGLLIRKVTRFALQSFVRSRPVAI